jgi:hypothetical protein
LDLDVLARQYFLNSSLCAILVHQLTTRLAPQLHHFGVNLVEANVPILQGVWNVWSRTRAGSFSHGMEAVVEWKMNGHSTTTKKTIFWEPTITLISMQWAVVDIWTLDFFGPI